MKDPNAMSEDLGALCALPPTAPELEKFITAEALSAESQKALKARLALWNADAAWAGRELRSAAGDSAAELVGRPEQASLSAPLRTLLARYATADALARRLQGDLRWVM